MAEKVTKMLIKVDLQCSCCYKKIKKILCKFPQIRDQVYDEKKNTVSITVLCYSPEKIRDKIISKGGETVQSVEILPDKPKKEEPVKSKEPEKPLAGYLPVPLFPMVPVFPRVGVCCCLPCFGGYGGGPCYCGRRIPVMCSDGCGRRADECPGWNRGRLVMCDDGCGRPASQCQGGNRGRLVMCDDGCGRPASQCQGGNRGYHVSLCDYLSEENATACTVM